MSGGYTLAVVTAIVALLTVGMAPARGADSVALGDLGALPSDWYNEGGLFALNQGLNVNCNSFTVQGSVFANSNISMGASNISIGDTLHSAGSVFVNCGNITGDFALQYGTSYSVNSGSRNIASYTNTGTGSVTPPINFAPATYATDFNIDYTHSSSWNVSGNSFSPSPGTYYIDGNMTIEPVAKVAM
jgi:hypothetical protein